MCIYTCYMDAYTHDIWIKIQEVSMTTDCIRLSCKGLSQSLRRGHIHKCRERERDREREREGVRER